MTNEIVFIHCQSFSRKPNRAGQCVTQVIGEGLRSGGYHQHVDNPRPPVAIFGDPSVFQQMHDAHVAARRTRAQNDGKASERAIRRDRHTLFTLVASYPVPTAEVDASREELARFKTWVDLTLGWVREQYGDQLKTGFAHIDESFPHVHFWCLPDDPSADATLLHPGKIAKREVETRMKSDGFPPRAAVAAGNRALRAAMSDWQDSYHRAVGAPLGFERDGPKRRRLSRAQYRAERAALDHHSKLEADRARLESQVAELEKKAENMAVQQRELERKAADFLELAERHHKRMRKEAAQVTAFDAMLDALAAELENGTISYNPATGWKMGDPTPFRAAGRVWTKLEPPVRRLVALAQASDDGRLTGAGCEPRPLIAP